MTDLEAIELRHSRRSYLGTPISKENIALLQSVIDQYNNESGLTIQLVEDRQEAFRGFTIAYGMFSGVRSYIAIVGKTSDIHLKEKAGYYGEKLILEAVKLGLSTCWVGGTYNRKHLACTISEGEDLIILITIGYAQEKKGLKENAIYRFTHHRSKSLEELFTSDTAAPDWFLLGMKAVQKAPSAINKQPVKFHYQEKTVTAEVEDSTPYQRIDLGIAKLHFEIGAGRGRFELGNKAKWLA